MAAGVESAIGASVDSGFVHDAPALMTALIDAAALARMLHAALERGFPIERPALLAAESLLRAVYVAQPALVAREVERVLAVLEGEEPVTDELLPEHAMTATRAIEQLLALGYERFFAGRTAA